MAAQYPLGSGLPAIPGRHLDEFVFRFNRRNSRTRGMLFYRVPVLAVGYDPVRYSEGVRPANTRANEVQEGERT